MVTMRYMLLTILCCGLFGTQLLAQQKRGGVSAIARSSEQEILLRWAPKDPMTWKLANKYGYTIERFTIGQNGQVDSTGQWLRVVLTQQPVKPWPLEQWESMATKDAYAAIAAQAIYGETFEVTAPTGDVVAFINQVKEEKNRFGFALFAADHSLDAAQASGLRWKDTAVRKGEEYLYRIAVAPHPGNLPIDTALVTAQAVVPPPLPEPQEVSVRFGDHVASISWNGFYFSHEYVSYVVEKSEEGKIFSPVNDLPIVSGDRPDGESQQVMLMDSLAQNGKRYYYRVRGITAFSEAGPPSAVVSGVGVVSLAEVYPSIDTVLVASNQSALIQWSFPEDMKKHVTGYQVVRSASLNGAYQPLHQGLIGPAVFSFKDKAPLSTSYYRVKAMGADSTFTGSVPSMLALEDSLPPVLPVRFEGKVNTDGEVLLHWSESISSDILGYRLYRANDLKEEFMMISAQTIKDTAYVDRILVATLTEQVYYKLVAIDRHFNVSDYSEALILKRPDVVPPVAAQLTSVTAINTGIQLLWAASPSTDLSGYVLLRNQGNTAGYQVLKEFAVGDSTYTFLDSLVKPNTTYRYILRTIDDDGLNAAHPSTPVTALDAQSPDEIKNLTPRVDREKRQIVLRWTKSSDKSISGYRIFRAAGQEPLRHYQYSSHQETLFLDRQIQISKRYRYAVQALFEDGSESRLSMEVIAEY